MKNKLIKAIVLSSICYSASSSAFTLAIANFAQDAVDNYIEVEQWIQQKSMMFEKFQQEKLGQMLQTENDNKNTTTQLNADNQREEMNSMASALNDSSPDVDACRVFASETRKADLGQRINNLRNSTAATHDGLRDTSGLSEAKQDEKDLVVKTLLIEECKEISTLDRDDPDATDISYYLHSECSSVDAFYSKNRVLSEEEVVAGNVINQILSDAFPVRTNERLMKLDTPDAQSAKVKYMYNDLLDKIARDARLEIMEEKIPGADGMSQIDSILSVNDEKFGSPEWISAVANVTDADDPDAKNQIGTAELARKQTAIMAYNSHLMTMQYNKLNSLLLVQSAILTRLNQLSKDRQ